MPSIENNLVIWSHCSFDETGTYSVDSAARLLQSTENSLNLDPTLFRLNKEFKSKPSSIQLQKLSHITLQNRSFFAYKNRRQNAMYYCCCMKNISRKRPILLKIQNIKLFAEISTFLSQQNELKKKCSTFLSKKWSIKMIKTKVENMIRHFGWQKLSIKYD